MTDPELEKILTRFKPASPSASLRQRIVGIAERRAPSPSGWVWMIELAALLAAVVIQAGATRTFDLLPSPGAEATERHRWMWVEATNAFGEGESARLAAEAWISRAEGLEVSATQKALEVSWLE